MTDQKTQILHNYWGYAHFRPPQDGIIDQILSGRDTIALLPTGGGKSLCFQLPALLFPGKTVVVSPLISLMQDQVAGLNNRNISARAIYSGMSASQIEAILDNFVHGPLKILYISPERLVTEAFQVRFHQARVSLIAVDEAHCISQWGHDFRPAYLHINMLREIKPDVPMIALTATATPTILEDIAQQLGLKEPAVFRKSFARENISFSTIKTDDKPTEFKRLIDSLKGSGIVYSRSRLGSAKIAAWLRKNKVSAQHYHGGMSADERAEVQQKWMENKVRIIAATNAFGMGIDKADVRFVIHMDIPPSIEEFYQEAGRAGRDGKNSFAISLISNHDISSVLKNFDNYHPTLEEIKEVYTKICRHLKLAYGSGEGASYFLDLEKFCLDQKIPASKASTALQILEKQEWLMLADSLKNPSRVQVVCHPRQVNDVYEESDIRYKVLTQLLRNYEGIFTDMVEINEGQLSRALNVDFQKVVGYLLVLQNEAMIHYDRSLDLPKITFLKARPDDDSFRIDEKAYTRIKEAAKNRLQQVIQYHVTDRCRQQVILDYFGETDEMTCGKCDVCLGSQKRNYSNSDRQEVLARIAASKNGILPKDVLLSFPYNKRNRVYQCLEDLEAEAVIKINESGFIEKTRQK